jgi:hypothetical protein
MFITKNLSDQQKRGVIVCIPKTTRPHQPSDYRPITRLNTAYKILARIMVNRIRPTLEELLHPSQYCGLPGNTIFDATATVREAIAFAEITRPCAWFPWISKRHLIEYHISTCSPSCTATRWSAYNICMTTQRRWPSQRTYVHPLPHSVLYQRGVSVKHDVVRPLHKPNDPSSGATTPGHCRDFLWLGHKDGDVVRVHDYRSLPLSPVDADAPELLLQTMDQWVYARWRTSTYVIFYQMPLWNPGKPYTRASVLIKQRLLPLSLSQLPRILYSPVVHNIDLCAAVPLMWVLSGLP